MKFLLILLLSAQLCTASSNIDDEKRIKHTLLKYNYGIIKMTKSGNTKLLKDMLPEKLYFKLMIWADSWKFSNLAMVARINDFRFSPITYNENNATIRTMENWTFGYADLVKKDYALKPMTMFYKMKYTLKKHHGEWIIVEIKHLEEKDATKEHKPSLEKTEQEPVEES